MHQGGRVRNLCQLRRWRRGRMSLQAHYRPCAGRPVPGALLVCPQPCQLGICALADVALVGALSRVEAHMVTESGWLAKAAVAETADEGLVQSVYAHVGAQVTAGVEAAVADDAAHTAGSRERGSRGGVAQVKIICGQRIEAWSEDRS